MARQRLVNMISIVIIVVSLTVIGIVALMGARMFKERGGGLVLSGTASTVVSEADVAWNGEYSNFLICGIDQSGLLADVIMVAAIDNRSGRITVLQIPRDTYAGKDVVSHKYNALYGHVPAGTSGMENLKAHILRDFGIPINHYAAITTRGLDNLVDSVGGVDVYVPRTMNYDDDVQDLHIHLKKGWQHLNGSQAEQMVRERKVYAEGDLGRLETQKLFLAALVQKLQKQNALTLTTKVLPALLPPNFKTDLTNAQILQFGLAAKKIGLSKMGIITMPGNSFIDPENKLSYFGVNKDAALQIVNTYFIHGTTLTADDLRIINPSTESEAAEGTSGTQTQDMQSLYDSQLTYASSAQDSH